MAKLKANLAGDLGKMGKLFYDSLHTKDIEIYLTPTAAQATLHDLKLSAEVARPTPASDSVFEVEANIGVNKDNYYLNYNMSDQIAVDDSGEVAHNLSWAYSWQKNFCNPALVFAAGNLNYHSYSRVFVPPNAVFGKQSNLEEFGTDRPSNDTFGQEVFHGSAYAMFPNYCGDPSKYQYDVSWKVPGVVTHDSGGYHYHLLFQREAGIVWPLTLTVTLPKCVTTATPPVTSGLTAQDVVTVKGNVVTITGPLTQDEQMQFDWSC